jgi:ribonuclease-3
VDIDFTRRSVTFDDAAGPCHSVATAKGPARMGEEANKTERPTEAERRARLASERVDLLERRVDQAFAERALALNALVHASYSNENPESGFESNERLELLGDAVVDLAITHRLMERFPRASEGELSKLRARIVNEEGLARIARALKLGEVLLLGRGEELTGGRERASVLADALEAVIAALFLSNGLPSVMRFVDVVFAEALDGVAHGRQGQDHKTLLGELAQRLYKVPARYRVVGEEGPDHEKIFEVEVSIGPEVYARSRGRSKKEAEQAAAQATLAMLAPGTPAKSGDEPAP